MTTLNSSISFPESVYFQDLAGEAVILEAESGKYFGLDEVGTRMWQLLAEHKCLRPAFERLLEEYEVTPEQLEKDLVTLVDKMAEKGLVVVSD